MKVISRKEAKEKGLKRFYTGEPCVHGHISERFCSSGRCKACAYKDGDRYRENNIEKVLEKNKRWRDRNREAIKKYNMERYYANPEKKAEEARIWRKVHTESWQQTKKKYYYKNQEKCKQYAKVWRKENPEKVREASAAWQEQNPKKLKEIRRTASIRRRAKEKGAKGNHTRQDVKTLLTHQRHKCASCRVSVKKIGYHVDHVIPLARGGTNWPDNLQILCPTCNMAKGAKDPIEWAQELGRLL